MSLYLGFSLYNLYL